MQKRSLMVGLVWGGLAACGRSDAPHEHAGQSSRALDPAPITYQVVQGSGVAEAEHFSQKDEDTVAPISDWVQQTSAASGPFSGAAGGKYMQTTPDVGAPGTATSPPALRFQFEVPSGGGGTYAAYVRGTGPNTGGDSCYATITNLDGTPIGASNYLGFGSNGVWIWAGTATVTLAPGRYAVRVNMREDGVAVDKVVLQQSTMAAPVGQGPPESPLASNAQPFLVWSTASGFVKPNIVFRAYDAASGLGLDWAQTQALARDSADPRAAIRDAAVYLQEGIRKLSGQAQGWDIVTAPDLTNQSGIVLMLLAEAPQAIREDPAVIAALTATGGTNYGVETRESYYIRTESNRTIVVANRWEGLVVAVPELLESVGYEVIGMGPNWIYVPDRTTGLTFNLEKGGRPAFFTRNLSAALQASGQGTISYKHTNFGMPTPQAPDEFVQDGYNRWRVGRRIRTAAAAEFDIGAQPISHHAAVLAYIRANFGAGPNIPGFLADTTLGPNGSRPPAGPTNYGALWLNSDDSRNFISTIVSGAPAWLEFTTTVPSTNLDVSQPWVREILLQTLISSANTKCFQTRPDDVCVAMVEPEDGVGYAKIALAKSPQWFKDYRETEGLPFASSGYRLNGFKGLNHPGETWDPLAASDFVYGLDNWLLREYDKRVGSETTSTGKLKKSLIRLTHYSYNYWDVPANFNSDDRIRVAVAGYSKNRRRGEWFILQKYPDVFAAMQLAFPSSFQSYRWTYSLDTAASKSMSGIIGGSAMTQAKALRDYAATGCRALFLGEADINFGKYGLMYYLLTRVMLTPDMSDSDLLAAVDHWHQLAYGAGWSKMKEYYDLVLNGVPLAARGPQLWAEAMQKIDEAYALVGADPASKQRLDDLKTHWYHYYFVDTQQRDASVTAFREFVWKGQLAYQAYLRQNVYQINLANPSVADNARTVTYLAANYGGSTFGDGPSHYTASEINGPGGWWPLLKQTWPYESVVRWNDPSVRLDDLVQVAEFGTAAADFPFTLNASNATNPGPIVKASAAGEQIGFRIAWDQREGRGNSQPMTVFWGLKRYDVATNDWEPLVDVDQSFTPSVQVPIESGPDAGGLRNVVEVKYPAPVPGIYQFDVGGAGDGARFVDLNWNWAANPFNSGKGAYGGPLTFNEIVPSFASGSFWFYAPKGTTTLDFQYAIAPGVRDVTIYKRVGASFVLSSGPLSIVDGGVKHVPLNADETAAGCLVAFTKAPAPYFFSIPILWAKAQSQLLVPRAIAERDGLTIVP